MEKKVKALFEYQRFSPNAKLQKMIEKTQVKYQSLSDDDLLFVSAAGEPDIAKDNKNDLVDKND